MERVGTLINKLKEQLEQGAAPDKMLITLQMLQTELMQQQQVVKGSGGVSVVMPAMAVHQPPVEIKMVEAKQHKQVKKEEHSGWLFDPVVTIPTLAHQPVKEVYELNGQYTETDGESLNDRLKEEQVEVSAVLNGAPIRDLRKGIGVNDRYLFINELFRGDENMYERSIKTINAFNILAEAQYWIQRELKVKLGWPENSDTVKHFDQLVKRRFN
jgi:hypothetical protein